MALSRKPSNVRDHVKMGKPTIGSQTLYPKTAGQVRAQGKSKLDLIWFLGGGWNGLRS